MKLLITGTPGTGKTTVARLLGRMMRCPVWNEMDVALEEGIGEYDHESGEVVIPEKALEFILKKRLGKKKDAIVEGHVACETKLPVDRVIVLRASPSLVELRLQARKYGEEKIQDNVLCEGIDYCRKQAGKRYPKNRILEVRNEKDIKQTLAIIIGALGKKGKK